MQQLQAYLTHELYHAIWHLILLSDNKLYILYNNT